MWLTSINNEESVEEFSKQLLDLYDKTYPIRSKCITEAEHENPKYYSFAGQVATQLRATHK